MNRKELISTLEIVSRGVVRNNVIPLNEYLRFTGKTVFSFNDVFGVVGPCITDTAFAVHGPTFLGLLNASTSDEVLLESDENTLFIQAGK